MTLVAWILALVGAGLAFALWAGRSMGGAGHLDRASAMAVMPLPVLAMYFTATGLLGLLRAGSPYEGLVFTCGPFVIGFVTLLGVVWSARPRDQR